MLYIIVMAAMMTLFKLSFSSGEEPLQKGATWLLKRHFENNHRIEEDQITKIFELLPKLEFETY